MFIAAPRRLSVREGYNSFLGLIYEYQWRVYVQPEEDRGKHRMLVVDLAPVETITLDAALVLVAEYHRTCLLADYKPVIDDADWSVEIRSLLEMLGFYQLVQASSRTGVPCGPLKTRLRFVPFVSGQVVDGELADALIDSLKDAAGQAPGREKVYGGLVEAIKNVKNHAYPPDPAPGQLPYRPMWWAAGAYDPEHQILQFAVYDQGVGIPKTLPYRDFFEHIRATLQGSWTEADVIEGGIEYGRTSTGKLERGNGLWTICNVVSELPDSFVRILSGSGEVTYSSHGIVRKKLYGNPFCGTLVVWTLKLPPEREAEAER